MSPFGFSTTAEEIVSTFDSRIQGRTFLITGTSASGLRAYVATSLARGSPAHLILVARTKSKVDPVIAEIAAKHPSVQTTFVEADLSDLDSVRRAASQINDDDNGTRIPHIDVVVNNAGVMAIPDYTLDKQGHEMTLSSNHLGHFLLTNLLMPKILASGAGARIVNVTSTGHRMSPFRFSDWNFSGGKTYDGWTAYGQSKTANILFTVELARRLESRGVKSYAPHPGLIFETSLASHLDVGGTDWEELTRVSERNNGRPTFFLDDDAPKTPAQGAAPLLAAALDPAFDDRSGSYVADCQVREPMEYARDPEAAVRLWKLSEELVGQEFKL